MAGMDLGLLIGHEGVLEDAFPSEVFHLAVVVEKQIVLHNLHDIPTGFAMLLGTIYCLNLEYPKMLRYTFEFLQKAIMGIQAEKCFARVHGLRNKHLPYHM